VPQLERFLAELRVAETAERQILAHLKSIALFKYDTTFDANEACKQLFDAIYQMPSAQNVHRRRQNHAPHQKDNSAAGGKKRLATRAAHLLTANEVYYYLKKFKALLPLTLTREKFFNLVRSLAKSAKRGLLAEVGTALTELEKRLQQAFRTSEVNF
jgi:hypothetical protein